jgi:hypothetical protein
MSHHCLVLISIHCCRRPIIISRDIRYHKDKKALQDIRGLSVGLIIPTWKKTLVTKSEEAIAGYFGWQKLLRKARAHVGLSSQ